MQTPVHSNQDNRTGNTSHNTNSGILQKCGHYSVYLCVEKRSPGHTDCSVQQINSFIHKSEANLESISLLTSAS